MTCFRILFCVCAELLILIYILGESKSTNIDVIVQFRPSIKSITKSIIQTGRGLQGEINCLTLGEPQPKVTWYKGKKFLFFNIFSECGTKNNFH